MSRLYPVFDRFWQRCAVSDNKLHASQTLPSGITEENNFDYAGDGNHYHLLDCYYPENTQGKNPVIIDIHGGGWMYADKELNKIYCLNLAKRGFTVFNISYRLVPDVTVKEQLCDAALALRWIKENLSRFPGDEKSIMLTGDSAGGQLAVYSAAIAKSPELQEVFGAVDCKIDFSCLTLTSPVAFMNTREPIGIYGRLMWGDDALTKTTSGYMNINELESIGKLPPTLLVTSSGDVLAHGQTRRLAQLLMQRGVDVRLLDFPKFEGKNLPHVFGVLEPESKAGNIYIDEMCAFFKKHIVL